MNNLLQKVIYSGNDFVQPEDFEERTDATPRLHINAEPLNEATHKEVELHTKSADVFKPLMCSKQQK